MTFWKISDTRMNCLITQEEIETLGFQIDELTHNREKTVEFLNLLASKGKEVLDMETQEGVQSFYGAFLPDRSLLISISCGGIGEEIMQPEKSDTLGRLLTNTQEKEGPVLSYQLLFSTLDSAIGFCQVFGEGKTLQSRLYGYNELYYLMMDFENTQEGKRAAQSIVTAGEFGAIVEEDAISELFLREHDYILIREQAVEQLGKLGEGIK